jgi:Nif-specific regulatory protein
MEGMSTDLSLTEPDTVAPSQLRGVLCQITSDIKDRLTADRVSIFLFDRTNCELWSLVSQEKKTMCLDARLGVAGHVARTGDVVSVDDAYEHPLFYKAVDLETSYRTRTLLAIPLKNSRAEVIGVAEAVNKRRGRFTGEDAEAMQSLLASITSSLEGISFKRPDSTPDSEDRQDEGFSTRKIVGMSHKVEAIIRLIDQIRDSSVDVLIQGESGTGKELVARALHYNSPRAKGPFVALNCAALPDNLVEAELFGIEKGVATGVERRTGRFEAANHGTLFLDEIGDLNLTAQAKLLRALQERAVDRVGTTRPVPVDIRIIAATNRDLLSAVHDKQFRDDLYYRVKVIHVETPPLRDILEDVPLLASHFLEKHCKAMSAEIKTFTPAALQCLMRHNWPGNNRQLENEIKRLTAFVRGRSIGEEHLDPSIRHPVQWAPSAEQPKQPMPLFPATPTTLPEAVDQLERNMIQEALLKTGGNKQKAAQTLGLSRQGLIKKLKRLGL